MIRPRDTHEVTEEEQTAALRILVRLTADDLVKKIGLNDTLILRNKTTRCVGLRVDSMSRDLLLKCLQAFKDALEEAND